VPVWQALPGAVHWPPAVQETQLPLLHTWLVPHDVPSGTLDRLAQVSWPVMQELVPCWHGLVGDLQVPLETHAMHWPELHTRLVPHDVPSATFAVKAHVELPVAHVVWPFWHGLLEGLHAVPAVQFTHEPALQTWLFPQVIPFAADTGLMHAEVPVAQDVVPVWQTLLLYTQPTLAVQATQVPPLHTWLVPHGVPSVTFAVLSVHCEVPDEQLDVPVLQTLPPGLHVAPVWQAPQVPLLHTAAPAAEVHAEPFAATPVCVQTGEPVLQSMVPVRHELPPGKHEAPLVQDTHPPSLHTSLVPHGVPLAMVVDASALQTDEPDPHPVTEVWHMLPPGLQFEPAVQELQLPLPSHTWLTPHAVPAGALVPRSMQMRAPPEHDAEPRWQGLPPGMHGAPAVHGAHTPLLQNSLVPHCVPLGAKPPSTHTGDPVEHAIVACPQDPAVAQLVPIGQAMHVPLLQTAPASHCVPEISWAITLHTEVPPSAHAMTPMTHASGAQVMPGVHTVASATASSPPSWASGPPVSMTAAASASASGPLSIVETLWSTEESLLPVMPVDASGEPCAKSPRSDVHPAPAAPEESASTKNPQSLLRGM
jgi:hypothetical protein